MVICLHEVWLFHISYRSISEVKQRWVWLVLGWVLGSYKLLLIEMTVIYCESLLLNHPIEWILVLSTSYLANTVFLRLYWNIIVKHRLKSLALWWSRRTYWSSSCRHVYIYLVDQVSYEHNQVRCNLNYLLINIYLICRFSSSSCPGSCYASVFEKVEYNDVNKWFCWICFNICYWQEFRYSWSSSARSTWRTFTSTEMKMKTIGE